MKRFTPEQIAAELREADRDLGKGLTVKEVCRKIEITEQTYYRWRQKYGGMSPELIKEQKALQKENARRLEGVREKGPEALHRFWEARSPETFRRLAREAGLPSFEVIGDGGPDPPDLHAAPGIWLRFGKDAPNER